MIDKAIGLLGLRAVDKVTGVEGVVSSVSFDLYGCVMVTLTPRIKPDGTMPDMRWFDVARIDVQPGDRVLPIPDFAAVATVPEEYSHGPSEKPALRT